MSNQQLTESTPGTGTFGRELSVIRTAYGKHVEEFRKPLYYYCLSLTKDPIEAEDLLQETMMRCFAQLAEVWIDLPDFKSYHYRTATNLWINQNKKFAPSPEENVEEFAQSEPINIENKDIRDLAIAVSATCAETERAALMLKDILGYSLEETASHMNTSVSAIKSALVRARKKMLALGEEKQRGSKRKLKASKNLVHGFVDALNARDPDQAVSYFAQHAVGEIIGAGYEMGVDALRNGSLGVNATYAEFAKAEVVNWRDELIVVMYVNEDGRTYPNCVLLLEEQDGKLTKMRTVFYNAYALKEIGEETGIPIEPVEIVPFTRSK